MEHALTETANCVLRQSWQIAGVFILVAAACRLLRKASAHWRYLLWLVVLAKCLVPPLVVLPVAVLPAAQPPNMAPSSRAPVGPMSPGAAGLKPVLPEADALPLAASPSGAPAIEPAEEALHSTGVSPAAEPGRGEAPPGLTAAQWAAVGWIAGVAGFLLFVLLKACRTDRRLKRARQPASAWLQGEVAELARRLGLPAAPRLWLVDGFGQPFVWGLLRGGIYLPGRFGKAETPEDRRGILMHELAHVSRWDAAVNALQVLAQGLFFFHPLLWWANRRIRQEREKCCDETAIAALAAQPKAYGSAIVDALVAEGESRRPIPSLALAGPVKNLEERIKTIMRPNRKFHRRPTWAAIVTVVLLAGVAVPTGLLLTARAERPSKQPPVAEAESVVMVPCRQKYSVMLVVGRDTMTFEGQDVSWEELPALLQKVPNRDRTVLAVAVADPADSKEDKRRPIISRAMPLCKRLGFDYLSFVGVHPLGSRGKTWFEPTVTPQQADRKVAIRPAARRFMGQWSGLAVDKPGEGSSSEPLRIDLRLSEAGRLEGLASGGFVESGRGALDNVRVYGDRLSFELRHRRGMPMGVSLVLKGGRLRGEAIPIGSDEDACDITLERSVAPLLKGLWTGLAVDKPGEGSSRDPLTVELKATDDGRLEGAASGRFVKSGSRKLENVRLSGGRLRFEVLHRTDARMAVTLRLVDGTLQGEGIPISSDEDACDITLSRRAPGPARRAKPPRPLPG